MHDLHADLIKHIHRDAQHNLRDNVGRRQDRRKHEDPEEDILPALGQLFIFHPAHMRCNIQSHRQFKHNAEREQEGKEKVDILVNGKHRRRQILARHQEEINGEIVDIPIAEHNAQQEEELKRLEALYELDSQYPEYNKVAASVIAKDPGTWYSVFVIDKGTDDGIAADMNVIAGGGLVGIVTETGKTWSVVRSIIDDRSNLSAMIASTSDTMVVTGNLLTMEEGTIDFSELSDPDNVVVEGTTVVTSNISTKYLTGLLVGYVSRVEETGNRLTKSGTIIPAADFRRLREVLVITNLKQTKENSE